MLSRVRLSSDIIARNDIGLPKGATAFTIVRRKSGGQVTGTAVTLFSSRAVVVLLPVFCWCISVRSTLRRICQTALPSSVLQLEHCAPESRYDLVTRACGVVAATGDWRLVIPSPLLPTVPLCHELLSPRHIHDSSFTPDLLPALLLLLVAARSPVVTTFDLLFRHLLIKFNCAISLDLGT